MNPFIFVGLVVALDVVPKYFFEHMVYDVGKDWPPLPLTGHEVARRLLETAGVRDVKVIDEPDDQPGFDDHYDSRNRTMSLSAKVASARTVAAYAVAAHETGHALQHQGSHPLYTALVALKGMVRYLNWAVIVLFLGLAVWPGDVPQQDILYAILGALDLPLLVSLLTIPLEWDASFGRGLPALRAAGLMPDAHSDTVKHILLAAALTYIAPAIVIVIVGFWLVLG